MLNKKLAAIIGMSMLSFAIIGTVVGVIVSNNGKTEISDKETESCVSMMQDETEDENNETEDSTTTDVAENPSEDTEGAEQLGEKYQTLEEAWEAGLASIRDEKGDLVLNPNSKVNQKSETSEIPAANTETPQPSPVGNNDNNHENNGGGSAPQPAPKPTPQPAPQPVQPSAPSSEPVEAPKDKIDIVVGPGTNNSNLDASAGASVQCPYSFGDYSTRVYCNGEGTKATVDGYYVGAATGNPGNPSCAYFNTIFPNGKYGDETMSIYVGEYKCGNVWFMMFV